jgi:hypothetical protein
MDDPVQFHSPHCSFKPEFEVLSAVTMPATSDTFGRVSSVVLSLSGHLLELELTPTMRDSSHDSYDENNKQVIVDYWPDHADDHGGKRTKRLLCLMLGGGSDYAGLALEHVGGHPDTFRRVGFVYSSSALYNLPVVEWFREKHRKKRLKRERQTVHLI